VKEALWEADLDLAAEWLGDTEGLMLPVLQALLLKLRLPEAEPEKLLLLQELLLWEAEAEKEGLKEEEPDLAPELVSAADWLLLTVEQELLVPQLLEVSELLRAAELEALRLLVARGEEEETTVTLML
jgi:phosphoglycolate phosphatase-like HAD superfamily hydrolase